MFLKTNILKTLENLKETVAMELIFTKAAGF